MHCFYVLVHGALEWRAKAAAPAAGPRPEGFYCHRYVLASSEAKATEKAFDWVRTLDRQTGWLSDGSATLTLEAEEVVVAPMSKLLKPDNRGHTFYSERQ